WVNQTAGAFELGDNGVAVLIDLGYGKGEVPGLRHVLEAGIREVAAGDLRAALEQVADAAALADAGMIERIPAELVDHRREEKRRIGDATGDHDPRPLRERLDDRFGPEIGFRRHEAVGEGGDRRAVLEDGAGDRQHAVRDQAAVDGGDLDAAMPELAKPVGDPLGRAARVDPALVGDDPRAVAHAAGQHRLHAVVEPGVVAREAAVAPGAHLGGRHRGLGHRLEAEVVERAMFGIGRGRLDTVSPPGRTGPDAQRPAHADAPLPARSTSASTMTAPSPTAPTMTGFTSSDAMSPSASRTSRPMPIAISASALMSQA